MKLFGSGKAPDSPGRSVAKSLPAIAGDAGLIPGVRKILRKETVTHSSILVGNPTSRGAWGYSPGGSERVRHNPDAKHHQTTGWDLNQGLLDFKVMLPTAHKGGNELPSSEHLFTTTRTFRWLYKHYSLHLGKEESNVN